MNKLQPARERLGCRAGLGLVSPKDDPGEQQFDQKDIQMQTARTTNSKVSSFYGQMITLFTD